MELKDYQQKTLNHLRSYLELLNANAEKKRQLAELKMDIPLDVPKLAWDEFWQNLQRNTLHPYSSRKNGLNEDLPSICFKVPTGGGKTFLAAHSIGLINTIYRKERTGFVLWIVPTTQIYNQTLAALHDRTHSYRQILDWASGGKTLILEKTSRFTPQQVEERLIIMLLMLPSANRQDKATLKLFQDSEGFEAFFPPDDNNVAHADLLKKFPNLDYLGNLGQWLGTTIKTSLGNTLRLIQPLIIIDEGHKAYSEGAQSTIRSFNPCFVLELSATPSAASNNLVAISGQELNREEMIKLDLNIFNKATWDWHSTLLEGYKQIIALEKYARNYQSNTGRYIRPICLIQVERTGKDQETRGFIHAQDAKKYLIEQCGINEDQIAIKSSETDGLENIDLLSPDCHIQYIITKQALQEGWDCAFAYVLVILTNPASQTGITQLVGRVLRQPYAKKTGVPELDESYVFCYQRKGAQLLEAIRRGFDDEGLGDLRHRAKTIETDEPISNVTVNYRAEFKRFEGKIYLPRFVIQAASGPRELSYDMDILSRIEWDWDKMNLSELKNVQLGALKREHRLSRVGYNDEAYKGIGEKVGISTEASLSIDKLFMTQQIADVVPNPWVAYNLISRTLELFRQGYEDERIATDLVLILDELKKLLVKARDEQAARIFADLLAAKELVFFLQAIERYALPTSIQVKANSRKLTRDTGDPIQLNLFDSYPEEQFNEVEKAFAIYLDKQATLLWWYRGLPSREFYSIQGWQKHRIYPDFITAKKSANDPTDYDKLFVLETKGLHLKGNADTSYKESVFDLCNKLGQETDWEALCREFGQKQITFQVIYEDEWEAQANKLFI